MHIIEELIFERSQKLRSIPWAWKLLQPVLYKALGYTKAVEMADHVAAGSGNAAFAHVSNLLDLKVNSSGLSNLPKAGRIVVVANHPTGLADGIAVYDGLIKRRPDLMFMANADALRVVLGAEDLIIPVEWVKEKRSREKARATLVAFKNAMQQERCVVLFPSGALAQCRANGLVDRPWEPSAASLARKFEAPIAPLNVSGRNSALYYLLALLNNELRDITLFHELLNKKRKTFELIFGSLVFPSELPKGALEATAILRKIVTEDIAITE